MTTGRLVFWLIDAGVVGFSLGMIATAKFISWRWNRELRRLRRGRIQ